MPMENIESVLVTVQANLDCVSVFKYAARLAERLKAKLFAVDVVHDPFAVMGWNLPIPSLKDDYRTLLTDVRIRLKAMVAEEKERGFPAEYLLREGDPAEEVIKVVQAERIDLLFMPYQEET
jgi:nucleotide-binding universal stress UspA family protein